jgi:hypothetical protein
MGSSDAVPSNAHERFAAIGITSTAKAGDDSVAAPRPEPVASRVGFPFADARSAIDDRRRSRRRLLLLASDGSLRLESVLLLGGRRSSARAPRQPAWAPAYASAA